MVIGRYFLQRSSDTSLCCLLLPFTAGVFSDRNGSRYVRVSGNWEPAEPRVESYSVLLTFQSFASCANSARRGAEDAENRALLMARNSSHRFDLMGRITYSGYSMFGIFIAFSREISDIIFPNPCRSPDLAPNLFLSVPIRVIRG